jgi:ADP-ribose pyrophosphatase
VNEAWTRVGDDRVAYDGFVRILHRTLQLPDGRQTTWDLLDTPASVAVFALTDEGQVVSLFPEVC